MNDLTKTNFTVFRAGKKEMASKSPDGNSSGMCFRGESIFYNLSC